MDNENNIFISSSTMMLEPCKHPYYRTKLLTVAETIFTPVKLLQLIQKSCLTNIHSTYQGRRNAVKTKFKFKQNVPIPINHREYICAFPTESPASPNCIWLFFKHVHTIEFFKKLNELKFIFQTELP